MSDRGLFFVVVGVVLVVMLLVAAYVETHSCDCDEQEEGSVQIGFGFVEQGGSDEEV